MGMPKGVSGNPSGRAKLTDEERAFNKACKERTTAALVTIDMLMCSSEHDKIRLAAAIFIIERAYGKAVQQVQVDGEIEHAGTIEHRGVSQITARITELCADGTAGDNPPSLPH